MSSQIRGISCTKISCTRGGRTLAEYLGAVRQAVLAGLEHGGSDPFRLLDHVNLMFCI